jgi:hypothetical protein
MKMKTLYTPLSSVFLFRNPFTPHHKLLPTLKEMLTVKNNLSAFFYDVN